MGRDKALLPHPRSGLPLIEHQLAVLAGAGCAQRLLSLRAGADHPHIAPEVPRVFDDGLHGPLAALAAAFAACSEPLVLVLAVDMPAITSANLRLLLAEASAAIGVVPRLPDGTEPLCAIYPRAPALAACRAALASGRLSLRGLVQTGLDAGWLRETRTLPPATFVNWNQPEDLPA